MARRLHSSIAAFVLAVAPVPARAQRAPEAAPPAAAEAPAAAAPEAPLEVPPSAERPPAPLPGAPERPLRRAPVAREPAPAHPRRRSAHDPDEPERLALPGLAGAYFYRPARGGRQRVLVYLHSRNANPREECRTWHESTPRFGWLVCPIGPVDRGGGHREWRNNPEYARRESVAAIEALGARYPRRVRRHDNVVMGFSEGAYVGMNVGLMEPLTFPRWLIVAANDGYIDTELERIARAAPSVRRIYLLTGATDEIVERSRRAHEMLHRAFGRRRVRLHILPGVGHELPPAFGRTTRPVLLWVTQ